MDQSPGILIVDDNEDNRYTLQLLLETDGHSRLACAANGTEAIAALKEQRFNLVLLDMMMPDLNGDEVLEILKADPNTRDIPVVMISADNDIDKVAKCIELGADDYLPKPFNTSLLRARISAALRRASLRSMETQYLSQIEKEKQYSERLLKNVLPAEIASRLQSGVTRIADQFDSATVLFADIVGFGKITAQMRAYEIVGCLNQLFSEFDRLLGEPGVEKIKTIGDNYMVVAGVPQARADHASIAADVALRMVKSSQRMRAQLPVPLPIRVGLHSGPVMAGIIGTHRFAYDVWGDTVNVASRVENASEPNRVLASAATAKLLGSHFRLDGPREVQTKEQRTIECFFIEPHAS
jgi:class 3 adenylate cyclase